MKKLTLILLVVATISACTKDDSGDPVVGIAPTITISSPANNSTYANGDTIYVKALAKDDKALTSFNLIIKHKQTGFELFKYTADANGKDSVQIDTFYKVDSPVAATGLIIIEAVDDDANKVSDEVTITITN